MNYKDEEISKLENSKTEKHRKYSSFSHTFTISP
jgi:hypothetical protein